MGNYLGKLSYAVSKLGIDYNNEFHVALCGPSGTGKSSLINCILGLRSGDPGSAPVGITETTHERKMYTHPKLPFFKVWDLPGAGTQHHPASTYFEDQLLYGFHMIIIVSSNRILEVVNDIVRHSAGWPPKMLLVWTKADCDLESLTENGASIADAKAALKAAVKRDFQAKGLNGIPMYVVSARNWSRKLRGVPAEPFEEELLLAHLEESARSRMQRRSRRA
ncbi:interferon-inducible GTPase-domain-containing protein [Hyaloraphidium curvatum]|nr:interferon-inducible GTPase-domain-containing protein [Hyaloraphidium curvatum]